MISELGHFFLISAFCLNLGLIANCVSNKPVIVGYIGFFDKLESLLNTLFNDAENINSDLIPVANAGLKLFVSEKGSEVRKNLLLSLVKDDKLELKDAEKLLSLLRNTFSPLKLAKSAVQNIISPA